MPMTSKQMVKLLELNGWHMVGQAGSHRKFRHNDYANSITVPIHVKDLGKGLEQTILKQANLKK
jgi:predicted RNA binding protein YcfA (HicA-like mRNA interferase family)